MSWTPEREAQLRELWMSGRSASQIASILGSTTRNAVIGKAHRLGLSGRVTPSRPERVSMPKISNGGMVANMAPREPRPKIPEIVERSEFASNLLSLTENMCKWPMGDPRNAEFHFCGRGKEGDLPYCAHHAAIAYQIPVKREGNADHKKNTA